VSAYGRNLAWGDHVIVVGLQQTGKSTLARELVRGARRVVFLDPKGDYARKVKGAVVATPMQVHEQPALLRAPRLRLVVLIGHGETDPAAEVRYMIRRLRETEAELGLGTVVVLDELHVYSDRCAITLRGLMASGHGTDPACGGLVSVMVSQRGVDLPLGCRALATRAYSFKQTHPRDLERLADEFGEDFAEHARTWSAGREPAYWEQERFYR
jgi:hypothetical protein